MPRRKKEKNKEVIPSQEAVPSSLQEIENFVFPLGIDYNKLLLSFASYEKDNSVNVVNFSSQVINYYKPRIITYGAFQYKHVTFDTMYRVTLSLMSGEFFPPVMPAIIHRDRIVYGFLPDDIKNSVGIANKILSLADAGHKEFELWGAGMFLVPVYMERVLKRNDIVLHVFEPSNLYPLAENIFAFLELKQSFLYDSFVSNLKRPRFLIYKEVVYAGTEYWQGKTSG